MTDPGRLPAVSIVIEWENAIDVEDEWTAKAMVALDRELRAVAGRLPARPRVSYLFDSNLVEAGAVERVIDAVAPGLRKSADLEIRATPGLSYYQLKHFGIARATTDITVLLDSDAAPQPGWLENLLKPFADPETMVVGGFTILAFEDLLSRTMALSWFFDLAHEREQTLKRQTIHVNNCAMRTAFYRAHPFPDLPMFKKQCEYWRKRLTAEGHRIVRTADAVTIHAPHPGVRFLAWRGWSSGLDGDVLNFHMSTRGRLGRVGLAARHLVKKVARSWRNILTKGNAVGLQRWQRPAAMMIALAYYLVTFGGQVTSALTRSFEPLPPLPAGAAIGA